MKRLILMAVMTLVLAAQTNPPAWQSGHQYNVNDAAFVIGHCSEARSAPAPCLFAAIQAHTSDSTNRPLTGQNWQTYWGPYTPQQ